ncbi:MULTISPECIES: hypothetical protein [Thermocrispum]|jgi:hypothetical protein|uniref:Uncharacterized protein n=1 Tax=Thermocrispum agreste TaxID=37925 RepID=A0A2W4JRJ3_9PSEU|nr:MULTISPECIES: hypothetical protein [Thermocrispum]PZN01601.1 MAG: hypothetical protein DIU77_00145 [Thermocrispum agreste]
MSRKPLDQRVKGGLPAGIAALSEEHQQLLSDAIGAARREQAEALAAAAEDSLRHIPRLLRGPVRKAVGL